MPTKKKKKYTISEHESGRLVDSEGRVLHPYYQWMSPMFLQHERGLFWYLAVIVVFSGLAVWFIFRGDFIPAIVLGLLETVVLLNAVDKNDEMKVRLDDEGVQVGNVLYKFREIKAFWFIPVGEDVMLQFSLKKRLNRVISVFLSGMDIHLIRGAMSVRCKEDETKEEGFVASMGRKLKI